MGTIADTFDDTSDFESMLDAAEENATSDWEMSFVADLRARYEQYGDRMFLSETQHDKLSQISDK